MNAEQKELLREAVLRVLDMNRTRFGLPATAIRLHVGQFGFPGASVEQIQEEADYLVGKGLAREVLKIISREITNWQITQEGIAFLDSQL